MEVALVHPIIVEGIDRGTDLRTGVRVRALRIKMGVYLSDQMEARIYGTEMSSTVDSKSQNSKKLGSFEQSRPRQQPNPAQMRPECLQITAATVRVRVTWIAAQKRLALLCPDLEAVAPLHLHEDFVNETVGRVRVIPDTAEIERQKCTNRPGIMHSSAHQTSKMGCVPRHRSSGFSTH